MNDLQTFSEWRRVNSGTRADYENYLSRTGYDPVTADIVSQMYGDSESEPRFTRDEVNKAVNNGVQLVLDDSKLYLSDRDTDLANVIVNVALSMLDTPPPATLDEAIERNYQPDPECEICGGDLSEQEPDAGYVHRYGQDDNDHQPVVKSTADVVRGWLA